MKKINHLFVSYAIANLLKNKGFNEPCIAYYGNVDSELRYLSHVSNGNIKVKNAVSSPTLQQVVDWFRVGHDIHIIPVPVLTRKYYFVIDRAFKPEIKTEELEYYVAFNKAIEEALKLI